MSFRATLLLLQQIGSDDTSLEVAEMAVVRDCAAESNAGGRGALTGVRSSRQLNKSPSLVLMMSAASSSSKHGGGLLWVTSARILMKYGFSQRSCGTDLPR